MSAATERPRRFRWTRWRRASQLVFLLFFACLPLTYFSGQTLVLGTMASLQLGPIDLVDPAAGLSSMLAARSASLSLAAGLILPLLLALTLGPVFCAWVCPWGLVAELVDKVKRRWVKPNHHKVRRLRWTVLALVMAASLLSGAAVAATISAPRLLTSLPMEIIFLGGASVSTLGLIGAVLVLELALPRRLWCRALCPVGSVLTLLRTPRTVTVGWTRSTCDPKACGTRCVANCPWYLDPRHMGAFDGCTNCGRCVEECPSAPAPSLGFVSGRRTGS